jgi:hypothetical protein
VSSVVIAVSQSWLSVAFVLLGASCEAGRSGVVGCVIVGSSRGVVALGGFLVVSCSPVGRGDFGEGPGSSYISRMGNSFPFPLSRAVVEVVASSTLPSSLGNASCPGDSSPGEDVGSSVAPVLGVVYASSSDSARFGPALSATSRACDRVVTPGGSGGLPKRASGSLGLPCVRVLFLFLSLPIVVDYVVIGHVSRADGVSVKRYNAVIG